MYPGSGMNDDQMLGFENVQDGIKFDQVAVEVKGSVGRKYLINIRVIREHTIIDGSSLDNRRMPNSMMSLHRSIVSAITNPETIKNSSTPKYPCRKIIQCATFP